MRALALIAASAGHLLACGTPGLALEEPRVSQEIKLKPAGLYTQPSLIGEDIPDGALLVADNVVINREGILEPRRGVANYATMAANRLTSYQERIVSHSSTGTVSYDNGSGTFTALTGTFAPPSATTAKTRFAQAAQDLFLTTSGGVYRMDAYNSIPLLAGAIKATGFDRDGRLYTSGVNQSSLTSNVVTVNTSAAHGFYIGQVVNQTSATEGTQYVTGNHTVVSVPSSTSFTYAETAANDAGNANVHTWAPAALATAGGFLTDGNQVAYRVVFNCPDTNNTEKPGAASPRTIITNASGTIGWVTTEARNVIVRVFVPSGITTAHSVRLYRSGQVDSSIEPSDELQLVYESLVKSTEITAGWLDITDVTPDALRGAFGYFAPSQDGMAQNNDRPPIAKDIAAFGGSMHYANTTGLHRMVVNLLGVGGSNGLRDGEVFYINNSVPDSYVCNGTPNSVDDFKYDASGTASVNVRNAALGLCAAINRNSSSAVNAYYISGPDDLPGRILLESKTPGGSAFTVSIGGDGATAAKRAAWAPVANALGGTFDLSRTGTTVTATSSSALPVDFFVGESVTLAVGDANFAAGAKTVTAVSGATFTYTESGSATTLASQSFSQTTQFGTTAAATPSRVYHSKNNQPEAVPALNYTDIGSKDGDVLRILALRESLFAFKEDGLYRGTGSNGSFSWKLFDPTVILVAPDSAVALGNQIYALTTQGVLAISDTGSEIVSRPIERTLVALMATDLTSVQRITFGIGYESERTYELRTISAASETYSTQAFLFNTLNRTWTRDTLTAKCGVIHSDNKRYLGGTSTIRQERKAFLVADYADEHVTTTVIAIDTSTRTIQTSASVLPVGTILFRSSGYVEVIASVGGDFQYAARDDAGAALMSAGSGTLIYGIASSLQWAPVVAKNPGASKLWQETNFLLGNGHFPSATVSHSTELRTTYEDTTVDGTVAPGQWTTAGSLWDGTERPFNLRMLVPQEMRRSTRLNLKFAVTSALTAWNISGVSILYEPGSARTSR